METHTERENKQIRRVRLFRLLPTPIHNDKELREVNLWRAVLDQALTDALLRPPLSTYEHTLQEKALRWINQGANFDFVCQGAMLETEKVRASLLQFISGARQLHDIKGTGDVDIDD